MKKYRSILIGMIITVVFITGCQKTTKSIEIENPEQISKIQLNTIRMDKKEYSSDKLDNLIEDLKSVTPLGNTEAKKVTVNDDKVYISLIYEDGTKDIFSFFKENKKWYLEHDGNIYANANFLNKYMEREEIDSEPTTIHVSLTYLKKYLEMTKNLEQVEVKDYFQYSIECSQYEKNSREEAISEEKEKFIKEWQIYKEAERLEIVPSEEELDDILQQWISGVSKIDNLKECESLLEAYHTSWEELILKSKKVFYYLDITNQLYNFKLYQLKFDEYAAGKDTINGIVYDNLNDYYNAYLDNEVYSYELTDDESKEFLKQLDEVNTQEKIAEQFLEHIFTSNREKRYTQFLKDENIDEYYESFEVFTSEECIKKLKQNRIPYKYDKEANEKGISYVISNMKVEFDTNETGTFEVLLEDTNKVSKPQKATGQLTLQNEKITDFFLSNIVSYDK